PRPSTLPHAHRFPYPTLFRSEQSLKQNPLAVLGVLRDLHKAAIPLRLSWNGGQLISKILAITPDKLVLDFGSQAEDNIAVLKAQHITITAETQGEIGRASCRERV